ncbi:biliverdin-producing heme oxygenase [Tritonibacter mobilis]|nr:biliverdin-producing heme oxygenase [Tritonibacter mobilis]
MTKAGEIGGRERLRLATDPQHQEMHHHPVMACLLAPSVTLAQIETASAVSLGAAKEIERARAASGEWADFSLSAYLQRLHHGLPAHLQTQHAPPVALPTDRYGALGGLYVIHGSAFGATLIANKIRAHLDIDPAPYFPAIDKTIWRRLVATLNAMTEEEADAAVRGPPRLFCSSSASRTGKPCIMRCRLHHLRRCTSRNLLMRRSMRLAPSRHHRARTHPASVDGWRARQGDGTRGRARCMNPCNSRFRLYFRTIPKLDRPR